MLSLHVLLCKKVHRVSSFGDSITVSATCCQILTVCCSFIVENENCCIAKVCLTSHHWRMFFWIFFHFHAHVLNILMFILVFVFLTQDNLIQLKIQSSSFRLKSRKGTNFVENEDLHWLLASLSRGNYMRGEFIADQGSRSSVMCDHLPKVNEMWCDKNGFLNQSEVSYD